MVFFLETKTEIIRSITSVVKDKIEGVFNYAVRGHESNF